PVTLSYRWSVGGIAVLGATSSTFVVRQSDVGKAVTVAVTGTKAGFLTVVSTSLPTAVVQQTAGEVRHVIGTISASETWSPSEASVYVIDGDVTVQSGVTLSMAPG